MPLDAVHSWATRNRLSYARPDSGPYRRRLDVHAGGALGQVELQLGHLDRAHGKRLGTHAAHAGAQPPLQRAHALPLEPVARVAGRVRLGDDTAAEAHPTGYPIYRLEWQGMGSLQ